jgi:hypothetical protein
VQIPNATFRLFPPLPSKPIENRRQGYGFRSLIHASVSLCFDTEELNNPEPGRFTRRGIRNAEEVVRIAAKDFLHM